MWDQFDINVMVNGSRCKQYKYNDRSYIEAKDGSEWYFQIQNNSPERVLAVCSVDGLNVLSGETATKKDTGYIIDSYHSQKIKGFRFSDDEWALFKFGYKIDKSTGAKNKKVYAVSKGNGADRNCGVIGVRLFYEKFKKVEYIAPPTYTPSWAVSSSWCSGSTSSYTLNASYAITGAMSGKCSWSPNNRFNLANMVEDYYIPTRGTPDLHAYSGQMLAGAIADAKAVRQTALAAPKSAKPFDMGTEWGKRESSKVETIDFDRGCQAYYVDIYYASRDSLIGMGVPLSNNIKVNRLPESFPTSYAKPPKDWMGE
jgi:hypothetical protein